MKYLLFGHLLLVTCVALGCAKEVRTASLSQERCLDANVQARISSMILSSRIPSYHIANSITTASPCLRQSSLRVIEQMATSGQGFELLVACRVLWQLSSNAELVDQAFMKAMCNASVRLAKIANLVNVDSLTQGYDGPNNPLHVSWAVFADGMFVAIPEVSEEEMLVRSDLRLPKGWSVEEVKTVLDGKEVDTEEIGAANRVVNIARLVNTEDYETRHKWHVEATFVAKNGCKYRMAQDYEFRLFKQRAGCP